MQTDMRFIFLSQMMAFCGHDIRCANFNEEWVLQKAKENVEKHYPVVRFEWVDKFFLLYFSGYWKKISYFQVGVLENLNMTLTVVEHAMPNIFNGAKQVSNLNTQHYSISPFRAKNHHLQFVPDVLQVQRCQEVQKQECLQTTCQ